jgi:hypothetical protein
MADDPAHTGPDNSERRDVDEGEEAPAIIPNPRRSSPPHTSSSSSSLRSGELRAAMNELKSYQETDRRELLARNQQLSDKLIEAKKEALELEQRVRDAERRLLEAAERLDAAEVQQRARDAEQRRWTGGCHPGCCSVM